MSRNNNGKRVKDILYANSYSIKIIKYRYRFNDTFDHILKELYPKYLESNKELNP